MSLVTDNAYHPLLDDDPISNIYLNNITKSLGRVDDKALYPVQGASSIIFTDGTLVYIRDGTTGHILAYYATLQAAIAVCTSGLIVIRAGNYGTVTFAAVNGCCYILENGAVTLSWTVSGYSGIIQDFQGLVFHKYVSGTQTATWG